jgi:hypothetical protein
LLLRGSTLIAALAGRRNETNRKGMDPMMIDALATTTPVLAAGWSLLYLLFGGGLGGAILIFLGLKLFGR